MIFRQFSPGEPPPLPLFSRSWRLTRGILNWIDIFPALAMSGMVIPFGLFPVKSDGPASPFSLKFLDIMKNSILTAIIAAAFYGLLCFLVFPLVRDREADMLYRGRLFSDSASRARSYAAARNWDDAARLLGVCERIWPGSPDLADLRASVSIESDESRFDTRQTQTEPLAQFLEEAGSSDRHEPVDAAEALAMAESAMGEERYYDAHWFATLSGRLAKKGSVEVVEAARTASRAWNAIASLEPNNQASRLVKIYRMKNAAYEAMLAEDWIRGYYLFKELEKLGPQDPDIIKFGDECEMRLEEIAFFIDESGLALGEILSGAVFSIPRRSSAGTYNGLMALKIQSLAASQDFSWGIGVELLVFNEKAEIENRVEAQYAKILPRTLGDQKRVLVLLRALDRENKERRWEPVWSGPGRPGSIEYDNGLDLGDTQVMLDIPYEDFLLSTQVRRGVGNFFIGELFAAERDLGAYGYIPQVFAAEILSRFAEPVYFPAFLILTLIAGWRCRAGKRPRYLSAPMLFLLPLIFNEVMSVYRAAMNLAGIRLILTLPLIPAASIILISAVLLFILSLVCLAYQHE
jgi:hypothetical protein